MKTLMKRQFLYWLPAGILSLASTSEAREKVNDDYVPKDGVIKDKDTAIKIAEIILGSVYGKEEIDFQKPLVATLNKGVWIVGGRLPDGYKGGSPYIFISKKDGRVMRIFHDK